MSHFSVREFVGMIWIFYGESPSDFSLPILEDIDALFDGHYAQTERTWQSHITYCIENQLDYTHLPDVHHNTIGRNFKLPKNPIFNLDEKFISIHLDKEEPALNFYFPNTWILNVAKKMKLMVFFAPINEKETILYLRTYNPILKIPVIRTLLSPLFNILNAIILKQDKRVVQSQGSGVSCAVQDDRLMKHDKAIAFFRKIWRDNS